MLGNSSEAALPEQQFTFTYEREKEKHGDEEYTLEQVRDQFAKKATAYEELRAQLRGIEANMMADQAGVQHSEILAMAQGRNDIIEQVKALKEEFLPLIGRTEELLGHAKALEEMKEWMIERAGGAKYLNDWTEFGKQMREASLDILYSSTVSMLEEEGPTRTPSPYEAIVSTIELRKIGRETADLIKEHVVAVCQSGSASWGEYVSTRGQLKSDPLGISQRELRDLKLISDVDMVVVVDLPQDAEKIVKSLVDAGRLDKSQIGRAHKYNELSQMGEVDMFSVRGFHKDVEQSYHIISRSVLEKLTDPKRVPAESITSLRDFRPDKPGSFRKYGGYPILGLEGSQIALLKKESLPADAANEELGYISESPAGGPIKIEVNGEKEDHYALGLIPTQLMYMPDVLHDTDNFFRGQIDRLFQSVASYLPKEEQFNVPRWERMPESFKKKLLKEAYKDRNDDVGKDSA